MLLEFAFDFDFFFANAMSFEPMKFNPTNVTTRRTDQSLSFHFPPFPFSKLLVQPISLLNRRATREGFNPLDFTEEFRSRRKNTRPHDQSTRTAYARFIDLVSITCVCTSAKVAEILEKIVF